MEHNTSPPILHFEHLFQALPCNYLILSPELRIVAANDGYLKATLTSREAILGKHIFEVFPDNPYVEESRSANSLNASLHYVLTHKMAHEMPVTRYDVPRSESEGGGFAERFWVTLNTPLLAEDGSVACIIHHARDVTAQVKTEQELITRSSGDAVWEYNLGKKEFVWSEAFRKVFGYTDAAPETDPSSWKTYVHPGDQDNIRQAFLAVFEARSKGFTVEHRFRKASGAYANILSHGYVLYDETGKPVHLIGSSIVSWSQEQEQQLRASNERFGHIARATSDVIWDWNLQDNSVWWNEGFKTLYGYQEGEIEPDSASWTNRIHPGDLARVKASIYGVIDSDKTAWQDEYRFRKADGAYLFIKDTGHVVRDEAGKPLRMIGAMLDITEKRKYEQQLQETAKQFEFLSDSIAQLVWVTDARGYHEYFNRRWTDYTGLTMEESLGFVWNKVLHPDDQQRAWDKWQHSLETGEFYEIEYRFKRGQDGAYRWFLAQAMPMRDDNGNITKWFGTCTDIEDHKKAEEELLEKNLELERINQDLDNFVYTASHDLKLPIINMAGIFEELTRNTVFKDPDAPKMIGMFNKSLQQIHSTIHDLAEVVKVQKTKDRALETVDLAEVAADVKVSIQDAITDAQASITTDFSAAPVLAFTKANLKSILYNLISNAIKYRAPAREPEIRLSTRPSGNYIELKVQDNGLGIDMNKHQSKLFQMFKRFHNHVPGSGLGLYIVNRLLTNHGGYINIESKPNEGTTFYLYFKQKKAETTGEAL